MNGRTVTILALLGLLAGPAAAHEQHDRQDHTPAATTLVSLKLPEVRLVDSTGRDRVLGKDVLGSRLAIVDFIYTSCTSVCPVLSSVLGAVQDDLGPRLGTEVEMVSVSIDPAADTPSRMREYAERFGAGPEWTFLTGSKPEIDRLLARAGVHAPTPAEHTPVMLVGDPARHVWIRLYGMPSPAQILEALDAVGHTRHKAASGAAATEVRHAAH